VTGLNENHLMAMDVINRKLNFNKSFEVMCQPFATCELQVSELVAHFKELIDIRETIGFKSQSSRNLETNQRFSHPTPKGLGS